MCQRSPEVGRPPCARRLLQAEAALAVLRKRRTGVAVLVTAAIVLPVSPALVALGAALAAWWAQ